MRFFYFVLVFLLGESFSPVIWANSIPINDIEVLESGTVLLATARGLERKDFTQISLQENLLKQGMTERFIRNVKKVNQNLLLGTNDGVYIQNDQQLKVYLKGLIIFDILSTTHDSFFAATSQGVAEIDLITEKVNWVTKNLNARKLAWKNDQLLVGTTTGLYISDVRKKTFSNIVENYFIWDIATDGSNILILSNRYTYRLTADNQLVRLDGDDDPAFYRAAIDASRNFVWLASYDGHLHLRMLDTFAPIEHVLQRDPHEINTLSIDAFGNTFVGTQKGLEQYSPPIIRTQPDTQGAHYIASQADDRFLCHTHKVFHKGESIKAIEEAVKHDRILDCHLQDGGIFLATNVGLWHYDLLENSLKQFTIKKGNPAILSIDRGTQSNSLLLGTIDDGLLEVSTSGQRLRSYGSGHNLVGLVSEQGIVYTVDNKTLIGFSAQKQIQSIDLSRHLFSKVTDMAQYGSNLYLATYGDGVLTVNLKTGDIHSFTEQHGLPDTLTQSIKADQTGNIWVSTFSGLALFDGKRFTPVGGAIEYSLGGLELLADGSLRTGSEQGVQTWNPQQVIAYLAQNPRPFISQLQVGQQTTFDPQRIELDYDSEPVQLRAVVASLLSSGLSMEYKIEGHDRTWKSLGREALFSLPRDIFGEYTLLLRIKGRPQSQTAYNLAISTPWYFDPLTLIGALFGLLGMGHQGTRRLVATKQQSFQTCLTELARALSQVAKERTDNRIMFARVLSVGIGESMGRVIDKLVEPEPAKADLKSLKTHVATLEQLYYPVTLSQQGLYHALKEDVAVRLKMGYDVKVVNESLRSSDCLNVHQRLTVYLGCLELMEKYQSACEPLSIHVSNSEFMTVLSFPLAGESLYPWLQFSWSPRLWSVTEDVTVVNGRMVIRIIPASRA